MQHRLGVAVGLPGAFDHQFQGGLEGDVVVEVRCHRAVERVAGVLAVHHGGHALEAFLDLLAGDHAVAQPVGQQLAGDAQGGAVFHQADVVDVRHLGAADALVDPADHVAEDALGVVVHFVLDLLGGPVGAGSQGDGQDVVHGGRGALGQFGLAGEHVDLVVVQRVQGGGGGRGDPGGVGAGERVADLLLHHRGHQVRHGPHALADLRAALQAGGQADVDVVVLVGADPLLALHGGLAHHGAGFHGGVDFVTGTVEEAGVDEHHALGGGLDAGLQVDGGAALLVHDADLEGVARHAQHVFDAAEDLGGEGDFLRAVHLRLDDVDRAGAGVLAAGVAVEVVQGDEAGEQRVLDALGHFVAGGVEDGRVGHQVADVAHEQQAAAVQGQLGTVGLGVDAVGVHGAGEGLAALADVLGEVAFHQAQPVAVDDGLVVGVDGGDGVLAVHDGGQGGFHQHVLDASSIGLADGAGGVDLDLEVQAVVLEQHGGGLGSVTLEGDELRGVLQAGLAAVLQAHGELAVLDGVGGGVDVGAGLQRRGFVEEGAGVGDDQVTADLVVALALLGAVGFADHVGAVERVVQRAPAGVGGVQGEAGVHHRHHQLRAGHAGDFFVDVLGAGLEVGRFGQQVADFLQEGLVGHGVVGLAGTGLVPGVDLGLQFVAFGEQGFVLRRQVVDDLLRTGPERIGSDTGSGDGFVVHEVEQDFGDLQATDLNALSHCLPHSAQYPLWTVPESL